MYEIYMKPMIHLNTYVCVCIMHIFANIVYVNYKRGYQHIPDAITSLMDTQAHDNSKMYTYTIIINIHSICTSICNIYT